METPQFIAWLDGKMANYTRKLIPPPAVLRDRVEHEARHAIRQRLIDEAIRAAGVDDQVEKLFSSIKPRLDSVNRELLSEVETELETSPEDHWTTPVKRLATAIAEEATA